MIVLIHIIIIVITSNIITFILVSPPPPLTLNLYQISLLIIIFNCFVFFTCSFHLLYWKIYSPPPLTTVTRNKLYDVSTTPRLRPFLCQPAEAEQQLRDESVGLQRRRLAHPGEMRGSPQAIKARSWWQKHYGGQKLFCLSLLLLLLQCYSFSAAVVIIVEVKTTQTNLRCAGQCIAHRPHAEKLGKCGT